MVAAALMIAHQVAGKAVRDGLFLAEFEVTDLPKMVAFAAGCALAAGYGFSRLLEGLGPRRLVPTAFAVSAVGQLGEFVIYDLWPGVTSVVVYLHIVAFGATLLSGFWSLINELFDPHEARRQFARIAATGTVGGILGGLAAERVAAWFTASVLLLLLAALHVACATLLARLAGAAGPKAAARPPRPVRPTAEVFRRSPHLWQVALLVTLGTSSAAAIDYLFKATATETLGRGPELVRFLAVFYTAGQVITFVMQSALTPAVLRHWSIGRAVASLPFAVSAGSLTALIVPGFAVVAAVRGLELVLRGSFYRSGYELFFTPMAPADKRSAKTIIDVGCDRLGDAIGAGFVQTALFAAPLAARSEILAIAVVLAVAGVWVAVSLDRTYVRLLEQRLVTHASDLDLDDVPDPATLSAVLASLPSQRLSELVPDAPATVASPPPAAPPLLSRPPDPVLNRLSELRSGDLALVRAALADEEPPDPVLVPQLIRLLAWDEVSAAARRALERPGPSITGQLVDALTSADEDFAVRRRVPRVLARIGSARAVDGLVLGLHDSRFEVRFQCGRALDYLVQRQPGVRVPASTLFERLDEELSVGRAVWESHRLLDRREAVDASDVVWLFDDLLRERANEMLEHVFSLLALVLPREPLLVAFRALHTDDKYLRGLALEYLESVLPPGIQSKFWELAESEGVRFSGGGRDAMEQLMRSSDSVTLELRMRAAGAPARGATQSPATPGSESR
jgi:hypothetical protein